MSAHELPPGRVGAALTGLRDRLTELVRSTPSALPSFGPRRRRVSVAIGPAVPGWVLRAVCAALAAVAVVAAGAGSALTAIGVLLGLALAARPGGALPVAVVGYAAFVLLTAGSGAWRPGAFVVLAATHLMVQLAAVLGRSGLTARVELAALVAPVRRWLAVQVVAQLVALLGAVVGQGRLELPWLAPLAVLGVGGLVVGLGPRLAGPQP